MGLEDNATTETDPKPAPGKKSSAKNSDTKAVNMEKKDAGSDAQPQISSQQQAKPGDISSFKGWVKDL